MSEQGHLDNQVEAALQRQKAATIHILQSDRTNAAALRLAEQVHGAMSAAIDALPSKVRHACAPGCFFCCYLPVDVLAPEAFRVAAHLKQTRSAGELAELVYRLGAPPGGHNPGTRPCVFLDQGRCSIYEVRPMVCRGYNSLSKERCEAFYHDTSVDLKGTKDRVAGDVAEAMEDGIIAGLNALGLDAQWYELSSAVLRALETTDGPERWARGEAVFEGCDQMFQWYC
ncbi:MAG TPA: YkgJ family cysteine cluster protein [Candidatus Tectomicrobia bacterium]|nr:YkgJ family cysteine cluster protein [Candidatus Tectomicrobia bacterium]